MLFCLPCCFCLPRQTHLLLHTLFPERSGASKQCTPTGSVEGFSQIIRAISFARDGLVLQAQFPMVLFPSAARESTSILPACRVHSQAGSGTYFFADVSFNKGHTHPLNPRLHDSDDIDFPSQMIRWPQAPSVAPVALATPSQRNPVPSWLPADRKTLFKPP